MKDIKISPKHGLNPSVVICPCCGGEDGVALYGKLMDDAEAPRKVYNHSPCQNCITKFEEYKQQGFVIFVIDDSFEDSKNNQNNMTPWMFFKEVHVVKREVAQRMFTDPSLVDKGAAFTCESTARSMGLKQPTESLAK